MTLRKTTSPFPRPSQGSQGESREHTLNSFLLPVTELGEQAEVSSFFGWPGQVKRIPPHPKMRPQVLSQEGNLIPEKAIGYYKETGGYSAHHHHSGAPSINTATAAAGKWLSQSFAEGVGRQLCPNQRVPPTDQTYLWRGSDQR